MIYTIDLTDYSGKLIIWLIRLSLNKLFTLRKCTLTDGRMKKPEGGYVLFAGKRLLIECHFALRVQSAIIYSQLFTSVTPPCQMEYEPLVQQPPVQDFRSSLRLVQLTEEKLKQPLCKLNHRSSLICEHNFRQGRRAKPKSRKPKPNPRQLFPECLAELYPGK